MKILESRKTFKCQIISQDIWKILYQFKFEGFSLKVFIYACWYLFGGNSLYRNGDLEHSFSAFKFLSSSGLVSDSKNLSSPFSLNVVIINFIYEVYQFSCGILKTNEAEWKKVFIEQMFFLQRLKCRHWAEANSDAEIDLFEQRIARVNFKFATSQLQLALKNLE